MADVPQQPATAAATTATATTATTATEGQTPLAVEESLEQRQPQPRGRERMDDNRFCAAEADASYQCLDKNQYDRTKCQDFFTAYRECKKKWNAERAEARRKLYYG